MKQSLKIFKEDRTGSLLQPPSIPCQRRVPALNIARGCSFSCVYCYARGYRNAPRRGEVYLYSNLLEKLVRELENPRRRKPWPTYISLNTSTDSFQPFEEILTVSWEVMQLLLKRNIGITLLTKGQIPPEFISLFQRFKDRVAISIGLVSLKDSFQAIYEPGAASVQERLETISRLVKAGINVRVRLDPLIPGINDHPQELQDLFQELSGRGIDRIAVSYLMMRPSILRQLRQEIPPVQYKLLEGFYRLRPRVPIAASENTQLLSPVLRHQRFQLIKTLAAEYQLSLIVCSCKNPDLSQDMCSQADQEFFHHQPSHILHQLPLFR